MREAEEDDEHDGGHPAGEQRTCSEHEAKDGADHQRVFLGDYFWNQCHAEQIAYAESEQAINCKMGCNVFCETIKGAVVGQESIASTSTPTYRKMLRTPSMR